jgi:hypothetical protein
MYAREIDLLTKAASKTTGTIYLTLTGKNWNISNTLDRHKALLDRNNLKHSIACEVTRLGSSLSADDTY